MKNESSNTSSASRRAVEKKVHILVIRLSAMGDVAMTAPVIRTLINTYPQLKITVLTRGFFAPMFKDIPNVSVYEADVNGVHSGVIGLGRLAKELRDEEIDMVADLHDVLRSNVLNSVFYLFGIPVKQIDKGRSEKKALTRPEDKVFKQLKSTHQRYADVFEELGYPISLKDHDFNKKFALSEEITAITGAHDKKWLGIAPFAQHSSKSYASDLMQKVLNELQKDENVKIFLFGGGAEELPKLKEWELRFSGVHCIAGNFSFEEELALIANLDAMLSMDSGNGHLAAMYNVPVITIWGLTHPYAGFVPFNQPLEHSILPDLNKYPLIPTSIYGKTVPEGYEDVMRSIPPETVVEKVLKILK
ncbi:glycosyltransferase family 9 protein [Autumnicola psychrophila]|uniref:Glycosyltransferase family 9 protein n=1 Tax=Autumnicola psychrophila TaxID=3075592 RepID=A0ABU3DP60_9FLAO|nr:glycosyltransferase family 9 protein [Zunongwangia sp. F225]MDT0685494.1 glycosyltransferase family 9 protein [Zunongwangia sp. F225]